METIDVKGLPEPFARAVRAMVETLRQQLEPEEKPRRRVKLAARPGRIIGNLTREEIYEDVG
ncbi:MAG: hypothetical protein WD894_15090 [Pirellulales bacterium]